MRGRFSFADLTREKSGAEVIPVPADHPLLAVLARGLDQMVARARYTNYAAARINEIGSQIETDIRQIIDNDPACRLLPGGRAGYPDLAVRIGGQTACIEIKTTAEGPESRSSFRTFYVSSWSKVRCDAYHLLVQLFVERTAGPPGINARLRSWRIKDLSGLRLSLKMEYNASLGELNGLPHLRSSRAGHAGVLAERRGQAAGSSDRALCPDPGKIRPPADL